MNKLFWLEDSRLGLFVSSTEWGYPVVLSLHALGMGVLVGISLMLGLRALGFGGTVPFTAMAPYWRIAKAGFVVNLLSGTALFLGSASELFFNWAFRIKLLLVFIGLFLTWQLVRRCMNSPESDLSEHRLLAAASVVTWLCALIAGRLIGYSS